LVHAGLQILMTCLVSNHFASDIGHLRTYISLRPKHHVLNLLQIFFILVELIFKGHRSVNFLLKEHFLLVNLFLLSFELFVVVRIDRLKFLFLITD